MSFGASAFLRTSSQRPGASGKNGGSSTVAAWAKAGTSSGSTFATRAPVVPLRTRMRSVYEPGARLRSP